MLADLINRQVANEYFDLYRHSVLSTDEITSMIPTAVVDVVRCKDCKYFDSGTDEDGKLFFKCLGWVYGGTSEDDFCSHGERKEMR